MEIRFGEHRLLIYIVKRNTKTDGMGPFNLSHLATELLKNNIEFDLQLTAMLTTC